MFRRDDKKSIPRKPVARDSMFEPSATETIDPVSTVRLVASDESADNHRLRKHGRRSINGDDLAPSLSRMELGTGFEEAIADAGLPTPRSSEELHRKIPRQSLEKPLPSVPDDEVVRLSNARAARERERELRVEGVVDLSNTVDTTVYERVAPAVTHETITQEVRHVRHEVYTREFHYHDVYHRIQPVIDIEVKPPRHFIKAADGSLSEIPASEAPSFPPHITQQAFEAALKNMLPKSAAPDGRRQFSAKDFPGSEGDYREETTPEGTVKTERWWVHPPVLETDPRFTGKTVPFHFESADPREDGLRM